MTFLISTGYVFIVLGFITAVQCSYCAFSRTTATSSPFTSYRTTYTYEYCKDGCCDDRCCTSSAGGIIGGIFAGIAAIIIICAVIACYCRRRRAQSGIVVNPNPVPPVSTVIVQGNQYPMQPIQQQQGQQVLQYQNIPIHTKHQQMRFQHNAGNQHQFTSQTHQLSRQGQQMALVPDYYTSAYSPKVPTEPPPTSDHYLYPRSNYERPYDSLIHNNSAHERPYDSISHTKSAHERAYEYLAHNNSHSQEESHYTELR